SAERGFGEGTTWQTGPIPLRPKSRRQPDYIAAVPLPNATNLLMALHQTLRTPLPHSDLGLSPLVTDSFPPKKATSTWRRRHTNGSHEAGETGQAGDPDQPERVPARPERGHRRGNSDDRRDPAMIGRVGQNDCTGADQADRNRDNARLHGDPPTRIFEAVPGRA